MLKTNKKLTLIIRLSILFGILIGGYLFRDTKPRSFLALDECKGTCLNPNELIGLLTSIGIQKFPDFTASVIYETDKSIAIKHPFPQSQIHYVIFPKKDIKNISEISEEDKEYLIDCYALIAKIIQEEKLENYQVITNGPGYQFTNYLHFHIKAGNKNPLYLLF